MKASNTPTWMGRPGIIQRTRNRAGYDSYTDHCTFFDLDSRGILPDGTALRSTAISKGAQETRTGFTMLVPDFTNVTNVALAHPAISRIVPDNWLIRSDFYVVKVGFRGFADDILSGCLMWPAQL